MRRLVSRHDPGGGGGRPARDRCPGGSIPAGPAPAERAADLVLLAGDLTERGTVAEAVCLADELRGLGLPAVAVLGNHDHLSGRRGAAVVVAALADAGVVLLENSGVVVPVNGVRVGIAGTMGFGGGFDMTSSHEWADGFAAALARLDCEVRVALTHYAPTVDTLVGERSR